MKRVFVGLCLAMIVSSAAGAPHVVESMDVAKVWSGHPVGFAMLTHDQTQYIAYYDDQRNMVVAQRELRQAEWTQKILPTKLGWDSHNYITMAMDDAGQLHVAGNMHAVPMVYFRTTKAGDATSLERVKEMVGKDELKCTYPMFMRGPENEFIFTYRSGGSGNGNQIYDVYEKGVWRRMLDGALTDGENSRNAYFSGPTRGPDGYFHLCWVWREKPDCSTNHDLSYARSKDLRHWESAEGTPLDLPMKLGSPNRVDPVPIHGGIINGNTKIGFDSKKRVIISYHKFDEAGNTQVYNARLEDGKWKIYQLTHWDYRWDFSGGGSIPSEIHVDAARSGAKGTLTEGYSHVKYGAKTWVIDEETMKVIGEKQSQPTRPPELEKPETQLPGMQVNWSGDAGKTGEKGISYWLRWETLGPNRDHSREGILPLPTQLRLYKIGS